jgi:hypothetical protein
MMERKHREQASLFYEFRPDDMIPNGHLLRRINVFVTSVLGDLHEQLGPFYSDTGRPSIDRSSITTSEPKRSRALFKGVRDCFI